MASAVSMWIRAILVGIVASAAALGGDWSPKQAARYLDGRQKEWFAWPRAASPDGPCVSCHTGLTYLLARPALRRFLGEKQPTAYETGLLDRLRAKAGAKPPGILQGVETIFAALFLSQQEAASASLSAPTQRAFDQLWSLQIREGKLEGAWPWYNANLDPWETPASWFYGASLAALAIGTTPAEYRSAPERQVHLHAMRDYLHSGLPDRPLHNRLALLWASSKLQELLANSERQSIIDDALRKQQPDGGWTMESLGPWAAHPDAPVSIGSHGYATGFAAYVLEQAGVSPSHPAMARALEWLKSHQDRQSGAWPAVSLNKRYPAGSMEEHFVSDAATAFAALALLTGNE